MDSVIIIGILSLAAKHMFWDKKFIVDPKIQQTVLFRFEYL